MALTITHIGLDNGITKEGEKMTGTQTIQAIRKAAPSNPAGIHANAMGRTGTTEAQRVARAKRTAQMAAALLPAIVEAYGADSTEARDAKIALDRANFWAA